MSARTKARKRALDLLYSAELRELPLAEAISVETRRALGEPERSASWEYAKRILDGVAAHAVDIDEQIVSYSRSWPLKRMPAVDRAILRVAVWELLYNPELPTAVAIAEAVSAARTYSTEDSASFVNGLLGRIAEVHRPTSTGSVGAKE